jgi:hypothetical protein
MEYLTEQSWTSQWKYDWIKHEVIRCAVCGAYDAVTYMKVTFGDDRAIRYVCYGCVLEFHKAYQTSQK